MSTTTFATKAYTEELPAICVSNTNLEGLFNWTSQNYIPRH